MRDAIYQVRPVRRARTVVALWLALGGSRVRLEQADRAGARRVRRTRASTSSSLALPDTLNADGVSTARCGSCCGTRTGSP